MSTINWMFIALILFISIYVTHATHFQGGTISYKVIGTNGSRLIVRITQSYTYVYPTIYCNNTYIANQLGLKLTPFGDATATLNCIANCSTSGGYTPIPVASKCTDYSAGMAITVGQRTDDIVLNNGSYFVIGYKGSAFRTLDLPSSADTTSLNWSISTVIDLRIRDDGTYNTPPLATMISPIYIPVGVKQTISIPTIDADNDDVRCRFANGINECGSVCPPNSLPSGTTISKNCTLTITGTAAGDWYAAAIQVEDFANSTANKSYSSVPVQFLIYVYAQPTCTQRPYLYGPGPDGSCIGVQVGVPFTLQLIAENYCSSYGVKMVDIATQSFPIVIKTPIVQNTSTLWSVTLTWTPTSDQIGSQVFCSVGIDSQNVQTNQYCLTFTVGNGTLGTCPKDETTTTTTTSTTTTTTSTTSTTTSTTSTTATETTTITTTTTETTTTTVENTTIANNTPPDLTVIIVPVIIIPICCCCYCFWIIYFLRPCPLVDIERARKPVTTYTIEGAYYNRTSSLIGEKYEVKDNIDKNNDSQLNTSHTTLGDISFYTEPLSSKSLLTMANDHEQSPTLTHRDIPVTIDTLSNPTNKYKTMMDYDLFSLASSIHENNQTVPNTASQNYIANHDHYPPLKLPTQINTSGVFAKNPNESYHDNMRQSFNSLHSVSASQSALLSSHQIPLKNDVTDSNRDQFTTVWRKHPRWVNRLSKPKQTHTPPLTRSPRPVSARSISVKSTSSRSTTTTIPRYAFYYED